MFNAKKLISAVVSAALCCSMVTAIPANAQCYTSCEGVRQVKDNGQYVSMQGMAADSTGIYVAKTRVEKYGYGAQIYRVSFDGKTQTRLSMSAAVSNELKHANDMFLNKENGVNYLYVNNADFNSNRSDCHLVKLRISGNTLTKVKTIYFTYNNKRLNFSAVSGYKWVSNNKYRVILKGSNNVYTADISTSNVNETVAAKKTLTLDTVVIIKGTGYNFAEKFADGSACYSNQGITYYNNRLYTVVSSNKKPNQSFIVAYDNISSKLDSAAIEKNVADSTRDQFRITSSKFPNLYEMESCAIYNGVLYYNTNRRKTANDSDYDAVLKIKDFRA